MGFGTNSVELHSMAYMGQKSAREERHGVLRSSSSHRDVPGPFWVCIPVEGTCPLSHLPMFPLVAEVRERAGGEGAQRGLVTGRQDLGSQLITGTVWESKLPGTQRALGLGEAVDPPTSTRVGAHNLWKAELGCNPSHREKKPPVPASSLP